MNVRKKFPYFAQILRISFLLILITGLGWIYHSTAFAEEDLFEILQINKFPERIAAPGFSLPTTDGEEVTLSDYKGKVILLNFWTTW